MFELHLGDKVKVVTGFYKGYEGIVIAPPGKDGRYQVELRYISIGGYTQTLTIGFIRHELKLLGEEI